MEIWGYLILLLVVLMIPSLIKIMKKGNAKSGKKDKSVKTDKKSELKAEAATKETLPIKGAYQSRWLFSYNEKDAYNKIKPVTDKLGLHLLSKVRLYDLVEPKRGIKKYKTYQYKIQSKHVDYVICDDKLVARCVIELDDSSHDTADRQERDNFVNEVLQSVGYQVIRARGINPAELEKMLIEVFKLKTTV